MWQSLQDQFPTTFMCLFLAWFLPWTMSWQYLDVPILAVQVLMALLFLGPVARDFGVFQSTKFGVVVGLSLLALGLAVFSIHQTIPPPPVLLLLGLLGLLTSASFLVSVFALVAPHRAKLAAWVLLFGSYWGLGRAATDETPLLWTMTAVLTGAGWFIRRRYI